MARGKSGDRGRSKDKNKAGSSKSRSKLRGKSQYQSNWLRMNVLFVMRSDIGKMTVQL